MTFARQRHPGLWTFDSVVEDFEFETFDENLSHAVDGRGGTYSLSDTDLVLGGPHSVFVGVNLTVGNNLTVGDDATFGDSVNIATNLTVGNNLTVVDDATFGDSVSIATNLTVGNNLSVIDDMTVGDDAFINGDLSANGNANLVGPVTTLGNSSGDAVVVNGFFQVNEVAQFNNDIFANGGFDVDGFSAFHGDVGFDGLTTFNDEATFESAAFFVDGLQSFGLGQFIDLTATGDVSFGEIHCSATAYVNAIIATQAGVFGQDVVVGGNTLLGNDASKDVVVNGIMSFGSGKLKGRTATGVNANTNFTASIVDAVYVPNGTLTATRVYKILDAGAEDGMQIRFTNDDTSEHIEVRDPDNAPIVELGPGVAFDATWAVIERVEGDWVRVEGGR